MTSSVRIAPPPVCTTYQVSSCQSMTVPLLRPRVSSPGTPRTSSASVRQELTKELCSLREELQEEQARSQTVSERLQAELRAINAEIGGSGLPSMPASKPIVFEAESSGAG